MAESPIVIRILRSGNTAPPDTLPEGQLAFSYGSGRLFIGNELDDPIHINAGGADVTELTYRVDGLDNQINLVFQQANAAFDAANSAENSAQSAYNRGTQAYNRAEAANTIAKAAYTKANSAYIVAGDAFNRANVSLTKSNLAIDRANSVYFNFDTVSDIANLAYDQANAAFDQANSAHDRANVDVAVGGDWQIQFARNGVLDSDSRFRFTANAGWLHVGDAFHVDIPGNTTTANIVVALDVSANDVFSDRIVINERANIAWANIETLETDFALIANSVTGNATTNELHVTQHANIINAYVETLEVGELFLQSGILSPAETDSDVYTLRKNAASAGPGYFEIGQGTANGNASIAFFPGEGWKLSSNDRVTGSYANIITDAVLSDAVDSDDASIAASVAGVKLAFDRAGSAFDQANVARNQANVARNQANTARDFANGAYDQANAAIVAANVAGETAANLALDLDATKQRVNVIVDQVNAAFDHANSVLDVANNAFDQANAAFVAANTAHDRIDEANDRANTIADKANAASSNARAAYEQANAAYEQANVALAATGGAAVYHDDALVLAKANLNFIDTGTANVAVIDQDSANARIAIHVNAAAFGAVAVGDAYDTANSALAMAAEASETATIYVDDSIETIATRLNFRSSETVNIAVGYHESDGRKANIDFSINTSAIGQAAVDAAYDQANAAYDQANAAFDAAQSGTVRITANSDLILESGNLNFINSESVNVQIAPHDSEDVANLAFSVNISTIAAAIGNQAVEDAYTKANVAYNVAINSASWVSVYENDALQVSNAELNFVDSGTVNVHVEPHGFDLKANVLFEVNTAAIGAVAVGDAYDMANSVANVATNNFIEIYFLKETSNLHTLQIAGHEARLANIEANNETFVGLVESTLDQSNLAILYAGDAINNLADLQNTVEQYNTTAHEAINAAANLVAVHHDDVLVIGNANLNFTDSESTNVQVEQHGSLNSANISIRVNTAAIADAVGGEIYDHANGAYDLANNAFDAANNARQLAEDARDTANAAQEKVAVFHTNVAISDHASLNFANTATIDVLAVESGFYPDRVDVAFAVNLESVRNDDQANAAFDQANAALDQSNAASITANAALDSVNAAANTVLMKSSNVPLGILSLNFENSGTANIEPTIDGGEASVRVSVNTSAIGAVAVGDAFDQANAAYARANAAFAHSNTIYDFANGVSEQANSAANTVHVFVDGGLIVPASPLNFQNTDSISISVGPDGGMANIAIALDPGIPSAIGSHNAAINNAFVGIGAAFEQANAAFDFANSVSVTTNTIYDLANTIHLRANGAYDAANDAANVGFDALVQANAAANTVQVYQNNSLKVSGQPLNFQNTDTVKISVASADGRANVILSVDDGIPNAILTHNTTFGAVNTAITASHNQANAAYGQANTATTNAGNAYDQANTATINAGNAYGQANTARNQANSAYGQANTATTNAGNAYGQANIATTIAGNAYGQANTARTQANSAYAQANSAYAQANTATTNAGNAYGQANTATTNAGNAYNQANTATTNADNAYNQANTARNQANTATTNAGNAYGQANTARNQANTAYAQANTALGFALDAYNANTIPIGTEPSQIPINQFLGTAAWVDAGTLVYVPEFVETGNAIANIISAVSATNSALGAINSAITTAHAQANTATTNAGNAYNQANTARNQANSAYAQANTATTNAGNAYGQANTATTNAGNAYGQANTARNQANSAYAQANTATTNAGNAYGQANSAANTVQVYQNGTLRATAKPLNFINTATVLISVIDGTTGNITITANTTANSLDDTTGRLIRVGDFGISGKAWGLPENQGDWNDIRKVGVYAGSGLANASPFWGGWSTVRVTRPFGAEGWVTQHATGTGTNRIAYRTCVGDVWSAWREVILSGDSMLQGLGANTQYPMSQSATSTAIGAAYAQANTATTNAGNAYAQANTARTQANSAYNQANIATSLATAAYNANTIPVGTEPNQIPLNQFLGTAAWIDASTLAFTSDLNAHANLISSAHGKANAAANTVQVYQNNSLKVSGEPLNFQNTATANITVKSDASRANVLIDVNAAAIPIATANWTIEQTGTDLVFKYNGTAKARLGSNGEFYAVTDVGKGPV